MRDTMLIILRKNLKVNLNEKQVQMGRSLEITLPKVASTTGQAAEDTIEPSFFKNIKADNNGYKWTVADTNVATVQTLADGSAAVVGVSTNNKTIDVTDLTITIQDILVQNKAPQLQYMLLEPRDRLRNKTVTLWVRLTFRWSIKKPLN